MNTTPSVPQFKPHSIKCPNGLKAENITAMCELKGRLYLGCDGLIARCRYNKDSSAEPYMSPSSQIDLYHEEQETKKKEIVGMYAISSPALIVVHYYMDNAPGPLVLLTRHTLDTIDQQSSLSENETRKDFNNQESKALYEHSPICNLFAISNEVDTQLAVLTVGKRFWIYRFDRSVSSHATWKEFFVIAEGGERVNAGAEIQAIGVNEKAVCFYAGGKYKLYWHGSSSRFTEVSSTYVPKPFVIPVGDVSFVVGLDKTMIVTGDIAEKASSAIPYNKGFTKQVKCERPTVCYWHKGNLFMFFKERCLMGVVDRSSPVTFKDIPVAGVRCVTRRFDLGDLVLLNDKELFTVGGLSHGARFATMALQSKSVDTAAVQIQRIKNDQDQQDVIVEMFRDLWVREGEDYKSAKNYAIQLLTKVLWKGDIREVLSLFPFIMLGNPLSERKVLTGTQPIEQPNKDLVDDVGKFLWFTSNQYKMSADTNLTVQAPIVDTAIFQYFAVRHETTKLDKFLSEQNSVDMQLVENFFYVNQQMKKQPLYPAQAIWNAHRKKIKEALSIWKALDDAANQDATKKETRWAKEASCTLHRETDEHIIKEALEWISVRGLPLAVNAFCHDHVKVKMASDWINDKVKDENERMMCFIQLYDYVIDNIQLEPEYLKDALLQFCRGLAVVSDKGRNERANKIARVIKQYGRPRGDTDGIDIPAFIEENDFGMHMPKWLKMEFYSIGELYEKAMDDVALNLLYDRKSLENFCRNAPDPNRAFMTALKKFSNGKEGGIVTSDLLTRDKAFILDNLEWFDMEELFSEFDNNLPLDDDTVCEILDRASTIMIQKERMMSMKVSVAKSMNLDIDYRLIRAHTRSAEIQHHTVCTGCNRPVGSGWITIAPDNRVYHMTCKPRLPPR